MWVTLSSCKMHSLNPWNHLIWTFCHILVPIHANDFADFGPDAAQSRFEFGALVVWPLDHLWLFLKKTKYHCFWDHLYIFFSFLPPNFCFHSPHTTIVHQGSRLLMHSSLLLSGLLKILGYFFVSPNFIRLLRVVITPSVTLRGGNDSKKSDEF